MLADTLKRLLLQGVPSGPWPEDRGCVPDPPGRAERGCYPDPLPTGRGCVPEPPRPPRRVRLP